jgi:hypothetical protein
MKNFNEVFKEEEYCFKDGAGNELEHVLQEYQQNMQHSCLTYCPKCLNFNPKELNNH